MTAQLAMPAIAAMTSGADLSPDGTYRYVLWRRWSDAPALLFLMLNPSTADARLNDPTIIRCIRHARTYGAGGLTVVNLYALRSPRPEALRAHHDPVGPRNDVVLGEAFATHEAMVCAYGAHPMAMAPDRRMLDAPPRAEWVLRQARALKLNLLTLGEGAPHPLARRAGLTPRPWSGR